jgi:hypothetical protein
MGRDRQCKPILIECPLPRLVKTARPMGCSDEWPKEEPDGEEDEPDQKDADNGVDCKDDGYGVRSVRCLASTLSLLFSEKPPDLSQWLR